MAAGARAGEVVLEVSAESDMSSTLPQSALLREHLADLGGAAADRRAAAPARRAGPAGAIGRGGACSSRSTSRVRSRRCSPAWPASGTRVQGLQLELALLPLYEGERPWLDLVGDLAGRGFAPYLLFPGYFSRALGRQVQLDVVFYPRVSARRSRRDHGQRRNLELGASADPPGRLAVHRRLPGGGSCCSAGCGSRCSGSACSPPLGASTSSAIPARVTPGRPGADREPGRRRGGRPTAERVPPPELELGAQPLPCIGIFMNVFDVHVNRTPAVGTIVAACLSCRQVPQRLVRQGVGRERAPVVQDPHRQRPRDRAGPDRRPGGAADRRLRRGGGERCRRASGSA